METAEYRLIAALEERHWWYIGMRACARALLQQGLRGEAPSCRPREILDAGCGTGGGLRWLAAFGRVTGLDYHPLAIQAAAHSSRRICRSSVMALPFGTASFDWVTSFDVLYHRAVPDDVVALREVARVLRPGGRLLARVPAHDWLRGAHDVQVHTRQRYSRAELGAKVRHAGLVVERFTYAGSYLMLPALFMRRHRLAPARSSARSDLELPAPQVNALLEAGLRLESMWLRHWDLPIGLSLLVLARKPREPAKNSA